MKFFSPLLVLAVAFVALSNPVLAEEDEVAFFEYAEASTSGTGSTDGAWVGSTSGSDSGSGSESGGISAGDVGSGSNTTGEAGSKSAAPSPFAWGATATLVASAVAAAIL